MFYVTNPLTISEPSIISAEVEVSSEGQEEAKAAAAGEGGSAAINAVGHFLDSSPEARQGESKSFVLSIW